MNIYYFRSGQVEAVLTMTFWLSSIVRQQHKTTVPTEN